MSEDTCIWCGKSYLQHTDKPLDSATPRIPCLGLKSGFVPNPAKSSLIKSKPILRVLGK